MKAKFESVHISPSNCFNAFVVEKKEFDAPWHFHPEFELTLILSGTGVRYVGNSNQNFDALDFVLIGPNIPHCWKNVGPQAMSSKAIVVQWSDKLFDLLAEYPEFKAMQKLLARSQGGLKFKKGVAMEMLNRMKALVNLKPFEKYISFLELLHSLSETNQHTILCEHGFTIPDTTNSERINAVYQYVNKHYQEKISLDGISAHLHMTAGSFSRFFSTVMKKTFFAFLNEYRINVACRLLVETDLQAKQICYSCGYESLPFFYRQFKKYKHVSPGDYKVTYDKLK